MRLLGGRKMNFISGSIIAAAGFAFALPMLTSAADIPVGRIEYERHCIMCHGATGTGSGWLAWFLEQRVRTITWLKKTNGGVFPVDRVYQVIDGRKEVALHGPRHMPVWGEVYLTEPKRALGPRYGPYDDDKLIRAKIAALVDYISTLQE
jgi:mono/diheme cytochrome c family protein